jgi:MFS family permease
MSNMMGKAHSGTSWRLPLAVQAAALQATSLSARLLIGYRALELHASPAILGLIAATYAAPAVLIAFSAGRAADTAGGTKLTAIGIVAAVVGTVLAALSTELPWLMLGAIVLGAGTLLTIVGQQSFVASQAAGRPDAAFGLLTSAMLVGQMIGPPVTAWISTSIAGAAPDRPDTTFGLIVCAGITLAVLPVNRWLSRAKKLTPMPSQGTRQASMVSIVRIPGMWRALLVSGVTLTSLDLLVAFLPVWATENGVGVTTVGWLMAVRAAVTVVSRIGLGRLVSAFGRKPLLLTALTLAVGGLTTIALTGLVGAAFAMLALGIGLGLPQPLTMSWVIERADPANRGAALGLRMTCNRILQIGVPAAVGVAAAPFGSAVIFLVGAGLLGAMGAVVVTAGPALDVSPPKP